MNFLKYINREISDVKKISGIIRKIQIIPIIIYFLIIYFFYKNDKCKCLKHYNKNFIKYSIYFLTFFSIVVFIFNPFLILKFIYRNLTPFWTSTIRILMLLFVIYLMISINRYFIYLKKIKCMCANKGIYNEIGLYYSSFVLLIIFISILITLYYNLVNIHYLHLSNV